MAQEIKIFTGGPIITLDAMNPMPEAVAVMNGEIMFLGSYEDTLAYTKNQGEPAVCGLKGHTLIPGFYESHGHMTINSFFGAHMILSAQTYSSVADCLALIEDLALANPREEWLIIMGYDESEVKEKRHLTCRDLDRVSTGQYILVIHFSAHCCYCNSKALALAPHLKARYPLGKLNEEVFVAFQSAYVPKPSPERMAAAFLRGQEDCLAAGVTTMSEAGFGNQGVMMIPLLTRLYKENLVKIQIAMTISQPLLQPDEIFYEEIGKLKTLLPEIHYIPAVKLFADGSIQLGTAYLTQPYLNNAHEGRPQDYPGAALMDKNILKEKILGAYQRGYGVFVHANGDAAMDDVLDCIERAKRCYPSMTAVSVLLHAQTIREDQMDRAKALDVLPSFLINHVYYWGSRHQSTYLGRSRAGRISPLREGIDRDMAFTLHCDFPALAENPLLSIHTAVNREMNMGGVLGEEYRISSLAALEAYTIHGAAQAGEAQCKGSITVGKQADFTVLDQNILSCDPRTIKDTKVMATIIKGKTVYQAGCGGKGR